MWGEKEKRFVVKENVMGECAEEQGFTGWSGIALRRAGLCLEVENSPHVAHLEKQCEMKSTAVSSL